MIFLSVDPPKVAWVRTLPGAMFPFSSENDQYMSRISFFIIIQVADVRICIDLNKKNHNSIKMTYFGHIQMKKETSPPGGFEPTRL